MNAGPPPQDDVVVVRATRLPPSPSDAAFSIVRLDAGQLAPGDRVDTALESVPGVAMFRRTSSFGANPTTQGVGLRGVGGSGASRALVTLDGVPLNDPFGGWLIWTSLPSEDLGGATIVRGAGAGPYGAGALTGVITLDEIHPTSGDWTADLAAGDHGQSRAAATAALPVAGGQVLLSGAGEHSDGWVPVLSGRGAADRPLGLNDWSASARYQAAIGQGALSARLSAYQEDRGGGVNGLRSRVRGDRFSLGYALAPTPGHWGWQAQAWAQTSDLANTSVSIAADRNAATLSNNQYKTPAVGYGANFAMRHDLGHGTLELGGDVRGASGEDREGFKPVAGVLTYDRRAGGQTFIGGAYAEATQTYGRWLVVAALRIDDWAEFDGHRTERNLNTGAVTLDKHYGQRGGVLPSFRLAARRDLSQGWSLRAASYSGFRAPTLNELHRPFRVGNDVTEANPALSPERLYGAELGIGRDGGVLTWSTTTFYNRLEDAIANVTLRGGPFTDPTAGFIPAGGTLRQRQNIPAIDAYGLEFDAKARLSETMAVRAALTWTHSQVDGGASAPRLTGLRPAGTPRLAASLGLDWRPVAPLSLSATARYESARFDDDQNTRRLGEAATLDARADWRLNSRATLFLAADNLLGAKVPTAETANGIYSYGAPRMVRFGVTVRGGPSSR
ncbi:MAG: TonB-dependent receptor [Caulobacteraceae bacterium]|nr:TonB-dependent receptor [Caulobacteraceae bacterium]